MIIKKTITYENTNMKRIVIWVINKLLLGLFPSISVKDVAIIRDYYENGQPKSETPYIDDKEHGIVKWYYENGQLKSETPYVNDKTHGIMKQYYKSGQLKAESRYVDGELIGTSNYDEKGNLIKKK